MKQKLRRQGLRFSRECLPLMTRGISEEACLQGENRLDWRVAPLVFQGQGTELVEPQLNVDMGLTNPPQKTKPS